MVEDQDRYIPNGALSSGRQESRGLTGRMSSQHFLLKAAAWHHRLPRNSSTTSTTAANAATALMYAVASTKTNHLRIINQ